MTEGLRLTTDTAIPASWFIQAPWSTPDAYVLQIEARNRDQVVLQLREWIRQLETVEVRWGSA